MLYALLISLSSLHLSGLHLPSVVEQNIATQIRQDSSESTRSLLVPYRAEIESAAVSYGVPAALLAGLVQEESQFEPWATRVEPRYLHNRTVRRHAARWSATHRHIPTTYTELTDRSRSYGLMQVMGETAREQGFTGRYLSELFVPKNAIAHGALLFKHLLARYHSDTLAAISAYNQGSARKHRGVFTNARYVYRVTLAWRAYETLFAQDPDSEDRHAD